MCVCTEENQMYIKGNLTLWEAKEVSCSLAEEMGKVSSRNGESQRSLKVSSWTRSSKSRNWITAEKCCSRKWREGAMEQLRFEGSACGAHGLLGENPVQPSLKYQLWVWGRKLAETLCGKGEALSLSRSDLQMTAVLGNWEERLSLAYAGERDGRIWSLSHRP